MNRKLLIAVSSALYGASLGAIAFNDMTTGTDELKLKSVQAAKVSNSFVRSKLSKKIHVEEGLSGTYNYIVRLVDAPIANYRGEIAGLEATSPAYTKSFKERSVLAKGKTSAEKRASLKLDMKKPEVIKYSNYLADKQAGFLAKADKLVGQKVKPVSQMKAAFNGVILKLTQEQAIEIAKLNDVAYVEREAYYSLDTDTGPVLIGAPNIWDGSANGGVGAKGEGVIIGILDTGVNTDNPSFADIGADGYDHTNPWGAGVYVGDCAGNFASLCNDKLIGVRSYPGVTDVYDDANIFGNNPPAKNGEDYNGHGSHTASTSGGNILLNVPMLDPNFGEANGDGVNSTGFKFGQISGVAPHANIVSYQICQPGNTGDTYAGCPGAPILAAINDAIADGVDVINYSISGGGFPWSSSTELAYLAAQNAGIFVATSAGNGGPGPETTPKHAPWYTPVAASTHGRTVAFDKTIGDFAGGDTTPPATLNGSSATQGFSGKIVYAGNFDNPNDAPGDASEQCLAPFPAGTFQSDQIVVCDRGAIARVAKGSNAAAGGAGGFVLANIDGGATSVANDVFVIPGIHINAADGNALKAWMASGTGHTATISAAEGELKIGQADDLAGFSSRGPNTTVPDIMTPAVSAPGVSIYAAYSDQHVGHDVTGNAPADFAFLQGTSMSSPHVAGAGALLKSAHPTWTPDNIRSALMLTATSDMRKEDGTTPADIFDMGSGRIRVDLASQTGLLMDETNANYAAADPNEGGDPKTLNIPSMGDTSCRGTCSWQRTFTATKAGEWTTSATASDSGVAVTVEPANFTVAAGDTQTITVTATINGLRTGDKATGVVTLTPSDSSIPTANLPMFLTVNTSNIPAKLEMEVHRDSGSVVLRNNLALEISEFTPRVFGLAKGSKTQHAIGQDSDNSSVFDDITDGASLTWVNLTEASPLLFVGISNAEAPDFDLRVGLDANGDGIPTADERVCQIANSSSNEVCQIEDVAAGNYWVLVQNWAASAPDAIDGFTLTTGHVPTTNSNNFTLTAQASADEFTPFDIRIGWDDEMETGDVFMGAFDVATDATSENAGNLGRTLVILTRGEDDVKMTVDNENPAIGDTVNYTINILANETDEDAAYTVKANIPEWIEIDPASVMSSDGNASLVTAGIAGSQINWGGVRPGIKGVEPSYAVTTNKEDASCAMPNFGQGGGYLDLPSFGINPQPLDGDTKNATFAIEAPFLGQTYPTFTINDDGFIAFGDGYGGRPWTNQFLPNSDKPNALIAPFWRDMQLDTASGSAAYVATGGGYILVEFKNMRPFQYYDGQNFIDDKIDFEAVINTANGDIMYGYNNVTHEFETQLGLTVGWENATGTSGANSIYVGRAGQPTGNAASITDGLIMCHRVKLPNEPVTITFSGKVMPSAAGATVNAVLSHESSNVGAQMETSATAVNVPSNIAVTAIANNTVAEEATLSGIAVEYTDSDSVDNTITVSVENGTASNISGGASGSTFDVTPNENFNGDMAVTVTVTDNAKPADSVSTSFVVAVTPVNDAPTSTASIRQSFSGFTGTVTLSATGADIDGDDLTYSWAQTSGPAVSITNANSAVATVSNSNAETGTLGFAVTVSDGSLTSTSNVSINVIKPKSKSGGGSMAWLLLALVSAFGIRRRR